MIESVIVCPARADGGKSRPSLGGGGRGAQHLAFGGDVLQTRKPCRVGSLPVQHQACIALRQTARHCSADAGACPRDDSNPQNPPLAPRLGSLERL